MGDAHLRIKIWPSINQPGFTFASQFDPMARRSEFNMTLLSIDLEPRAGVRIPQIPALHEFGHFLGLKHVQEGTSTPYGAEGSWEETDLMGAGWRFHPRHGQPWWKRVHRHRKTLGWSAPSDWEIQLNGLR